MFIPIIIIFELLLIITFFGVSLAILIFLYARSLKDFHSLKSEIYKKTESILEDARLKGVRVIEEASIKAQEIINKAHRFDESSNIMLESEIQKVTKNQAKNLTDTSVEFLNIFKTALVELKNDNLKVLTNITKDVERDLINELTDYKDLLRQETLNSQKIIEKKIEEEYSSIQSEINVYKEKQIKLIDELIYKVLSKVSELALGQTLNFETQEDLVIDALNKAKQEIFKEKQLES
ncbi:MAG: hypothetical protein ABIC96_04395 [Patescibacteria group bacterium]